MRFQPEDPAETARIEAAKRATAVLGPIQAWLRANAIAPEDVPIAARVRITGDAITTPVFDVRDGRRYVDPATGDLAQRTITVPLLADPPAAIRPWLALCAEETR